MYCVPPFQKDFKYKSPGAVVRALVLSLSVCYHARLQRRECYEDLVVRHFTGPITLPGGARQFRDEIRWYVCDHEMLYIRGKLQLTIVVNRSYVAS